jgi:hypothetical protein
MYRRQICFTLTLLAAGIAALPRPGAAASPVAYTSPEEAGPDFAVQGEYVGQCGDRPLAAQVVARGNSTFQAAFLAGGLPGAGWDGSPRVRVDGKTDGSETHFGTPGAGWNGTLRNGIFSGQRADGRSFELKKVHRESPDTGEPAPAGATVLFDGKGLEAFTGGKLTPDHLMLSGATTRAALNDFTLHVEFRLPFMPEARGQSRGNSGVYIQKRYEIQVLDSFGLDGVKNECGAVYTRVAPKVNMCFPPLSWQTYDIDFQAARWDAAGNKTKNAVVTVKHNGVIVQDHTPIEAPTGHGDKEAPAAGPINFQYHGSPIAYRNLWIIEHK